MAEQEMQIVVVAGTLSAIMDLPPDKPHILTRQYSYRATSPAAAIGYFIIDCAKEYPEYTVRGCPVYTLPGQLTWPDGKKEEPAGKPELEVVEGEGDSK